MGGVQVDGITVLTLAVTAALMAALTLFIDKTKLGKAMRAVSEDKDAATLMGISVDSVRRYIHRGRERIRQKVYQEEKDDE